MRLKQILINLISNAIKFTDEGFVKVNCKRENDYLKFSVIDSGIGIPEDKRQLVFERFQQAKTTTEKIYGGTGLGLAIAKACVDLLGGQINIKSDVEKGAHFYFTIKI
nr:ATP-binding protein [uncultured Carboxylicivirga sp.]